MLAIIVAAPAHAQLPPVQLPPVPVPSVPPLPSVPSLPPAPSVPSVPSVPVPSLPSVPGVPVPSSPGPVESVQSASLLAGAHGAVGRRIVVTVDLVTVDLDALFLVAAGGRIAGRAFAVGGRGIRRRRRLGGPRRGRLRPGQRRPRRGSAREAGPRAQRRAMRRADRQVRQAIRRYGTCLHVLTTRQRRVLRLRAGVGRAEPATRVEVARRLDLSVRRVRRVERRGLRVLERAGRRGCAEAAPGPVEEEAFAIGGAVGVVLTGGAASGPPGAPGSSADGRDDAANGGKGKPAGGTGSGESGGVKGIAATSSPPSPGSTGIVLPLLVVLLLAACAVGLGLEARRMLRPGGNARS